MQTEYFLAMTINMAINLVYTIVALAIGLAALKIVDDKLLPSIKLEEEIKAGNMAAAIFASTILLFVAIIVAVGLKG